MANDIPLYDAERYASAIDSLLKGLNSRTAQDTYSSKKQFSFKNKTSLRKPLQNFKNISIDSTVKSIEKAECDIQSIVDQELILDHHTLTYGHLKNCTLSSPPVLDNISPTGSLTLEDIKESVINITQLPYQTGSLFINDCINSVVIIRVPIDNHVQLRIHSLINCKIYIQSSTLLKCTSKQNVVIEKCRDCVFHTESKGYIIIQNFSNLGFNSNKTESYSFQPFDIFDNDTAQLKANYIST